MIQIAICDDNSYFANQVEEYIKKREGQLECEVFSSGDALWEYVSLGNRYQIYFMDIEMKGSNGIETAAKLRGLDEHALIIYMTEHQEYVFQVFETLPFRFLVKPFDYEKLNLVLEQALDYISMNQNYVFFKIEREQYQVPYEEIRYFEGRGRQVCLHGSKRDYLFYHKISSLNQELDTGVFCRIHTSYLVNLDRIHSLTEKEVTLDNGEVLPVSKPFRKSTRDQHLHYMMRKSGVLR